MDIVALDGTKMLALMVAGGTFALAGLWLMFRPQPVGEAARIEIFGLKFQANSAGVLVFLMGSVFLAVPIFVPEKPAAERAGVVSGGSVIAEPAATTERLQEPQGATILPQSADVAENDPNAAMANATSIKLGTSVTGTLSDQDLDSYSVAIPAGMRGRITASLVVTRGLVDLSLFDGEGQVLGRQVANSSGSGTASVSGAIESQRFIAVVGNGYSGDSVYLLTIGVRPD